MYVVPDVSADMYLCQLSADSLRSLSFASRSHRVRHSRMQIVFFLLIGYKFINWLIPMNIGICLSLEIGSRMPRDWFENGLLHHNAKYAMNDTNVLSLLFERQLLLLRL